MPTRLFYSTQNKKSAPLALTPIQDHKSYFEKENQIRKNHLNMRIATLQFASRLGDVRGNIERANELLKKGGRGDETGEGIEALKPDVLVLSEMALTG